MRLSHAVSLGAVFAALSVALQATPTPPTEPATPDMARPNIVVIMTDDQDVDSLPVMRRLMANPGGSWVNFTNAFTNISLCAPSRAAFLTGQYGHRSGVTGNDGMRIKDANTLPVWLDEAGYRTGLVGKYLNGFPGRLGWRYTPPGWDHFHVFRERKRDNDLYAAEAVGFINESDAPFFLYLSFKGPHKGAHPPVRYREVDAYVPPPRPNVNEADNSDKPLSMRRLPKLQSATLRVWQEERLDSQRELLAIDDGIQAIVDALAAKGVLDNTMIIFTADNGFSWGSHRHIGKLCPYEECSNVPLLIRFPGVAGNRVETSVVSNVDLPATIADYAGVTPGLPQDGRSLLPLLEGTADDWPNAVLLERPANAYFGVRAAGWKYIEYTRTGERELYDLTADPYEMENRAGQAAYQTVQADLARVLAGLLTRYSITGTVRTPNGTPIAGVVIFDHAGHSAVSDAWGRYALTDIPAGTYRLAAAKQGYSFTERAPITVPPSAVRQDFVGTRVSYSVAGRVMAGSEPLAGVTIDAGAGRSAVTNEDGRYTLVGLPAGQHTLTPALPGYGFTPANRNVTITNDDLTGQDFTAALLGTSNSNTVTQVV